MALSAYNIALCMYQSVPGGELLEKKEWMIGGYYYAGCNPNFPHNYVAVIRFTTEKLAKSVTLTLTCGGTNHSSSSALLCYGLGPNPEEDGAMINVTGDKLAAGTFFFANNYASNTITLNYVKPGVNYLYIWGLDPSIYSMSYINIRALIEDGITYEKLDGVVYIDNGTTFEPYEVYVDNGISWDLYIQYIDNGTGWDQCG